MILLTKKVLATFRFCINLRQAIVLNSYNHSNICANILWIFKESKAGDKDGGGGVAPGTGRAGGGGFRAAFNISKSVAF